MGFLANHRRFTWMFVIVVAAAAIGVIALLPLGADTLGLSRVVSSGKAPREIVLVARDMGFYLDGTGSENPIIRLKAGEEIRVMLRNDEPGVVHDFAVSAWKVGTRKLQARERDTVSFRVPETPGQYEYLCNPHASMMRGIIQVE